MREIFLVVITVLISFTAGVNGGIYAQKKQTQAEIASLQLDNIELKNQLATERYVSDVLTQELMGTKQ